MQDDAELLCRWANERSEVAFAELVRRHIDLVYAVARRQVAGDAHLAQDVVQQVFNALARKAGSLRDRAALSGWLYRSTHFKASDVVRAERRRRAREQEATFMQDHITDSPGGEVDWEQTRPALDAVIAELDEGDRDAVALRFFDGRSFAEIGARLRLTENAARMRVDRALDKLHAALARRGIRSTTAALAIGLGHQAMAAPAGLAATIAGGAVAEATVAGSGMLAAAGTILTMSKIKLGVAAVVLAAGLTVAVNEVRGIRALESEISAAGNVRGQMAQLRRENEQLRAVVAKVAAAKPDAAELVRLSGRLAQLSARPEGVVDAEMKPVSAWRNVGRATLADAYETLLWAQAAGDVDVFAGFIAFRPRGQAKAAEFFGRLPESVRSRFGTPERMIAASNPPRTNVEAFQVLGHEGGTKVMLHAWTREKSGRERRHDMLFEREADGWRGAAFSDEMIDKILASLDPQTGERRPNAK